MTIVSTKMPDALFRQAKAIADREKITLDELISLALAGQIASREVGRQFEERNDAEIGNALSRSSTWLRTWNQKTPISFSFAEAAVFTVKKLTFPHNKV